ncbi:MAG: HRDC domain-containing protein, partial [Prevotella sp.]|nr:HRDC domain-containing protein [Prevotella sp.]
LLSGYLRKDVENYGLLKVTAAGKKFIKEPHSFMIVENKEFSDYEVTGTSALDPTLNSMLLNLRKKWAKKLNCPPYVVFQDVSLEQMATDYPVTNEELRQIRGVGEGKLRKPYAKEFLSLIKKYCDENEIERHADMLLRTVAKQSAMKLSIVNNIDRKMDLEDIADAKGMEFDELVSELEKIVISGTKINIKYFLEEIMDEDDIDVMYEYMQKQQKDDVKGMIAAFESEFDENEIRLVRIQYISEMAN